MTTDTDQAWRRRGFGPAVADAWVWFRRGFLPTEAATWRRFEFSPTLARERKDAGFSPEATDDPTD